MNTALIITFTLGYLLIIIESAIKINKSAIALLTGVICWTILVMNQNSVDVVNGLSHHLANISEILFFLLGAMTIVELIDAHDGFEVITTRITTASKVKLLWIICALSFFFSAVLDNLTTAIVMIALLRKLIENKNDKWLFAGMIILAANSGGAWSPIGDVTTTMLWIGGQISSLTIIQKLFIPSLVCVLVPVTILSFRLKGSVETPVKLKSPNISSNSETEKNIVFISGLLILLLVPVFKTITGLPPYIGILLGLSLLWIITDFVHFSKMDEEKEHYSVVKALQRIDVPSILFFLGILLSIAALESAHILSQIALQMDVHIGNHTAIGLLIGLLSAVVDNVPLVAATMGMYHYPINHFFWEFIAYCAGTGGSILIIGSAAGVAAMGMEKIGFIWYLKKISWLALLGYFAGAVTYIIQEYLFQL